MEQNRPNNTSGAFRQYANPEKTEDKAAEYSQMATRGIQRMGEKVGNGFTSVTKTSEKARGTIQNYVTSFGSLLRSYMNQIPPLKVGVYMMTLLSSIPVATFAGWLTISFVGILALAGVGIAVVQSGAFLLGSLFLTPVLFGAGIMTFLTVGGFIGLWLFFMALRRVSGTASRVMAYSAKEVEQEGDAIKSGIERGYHQAREERR